VKFSTSAADLGDALKQAARLTKANSRQATATSPSASDAVRITARRTSVELAAVARIDHEFLTTFRQTLKADVSEPGSVLVDASTLATLLAQAGSDTATVERDGDTVRIYFGTGGVISSPMQPDFPKRLPAAVKGATVDGLVAALAGVTPSAGSPNLYRPVLERVRFDGDLVAATDSFQLAAATLDGLQADALMPAAVVKTVLAAKPTKLRLGVKDGVASFHDPDTSRSWTTKSRYLHVQDTPGQSYPDVRGLLDKALADTSTEAWFDSATLRKILTQALAARAAGSKTLTLAWFKVGTSELMIETGNDDASLRQPLAGTCRGEPLAIPFDAARLKLVLSRLSGQVRMAASAADRPALFEAEGGALRLLLMPVRASAPAAETP
jgi:DNA polymerase III sliding clamp (beta) subunit (PCNA family)